MKTRMVQSCIGLLLVVSIMLVLSGCLTLYTSSYFIAFKEEDRGRYTVTDVEITETFLTIYK
ncbi:MAG TPA: hypothetical protein DF292_04305 [Firmicutes bacterium]|jgi:hypothetical protein|nr:hypothetical protein [Bacillota bacterium]HCT36242.1 hypothetical protein [Bacillota bacterium]